jgi:hypothetical protein
LSLGAYEMTAEDRKSVAAIVRKNG